MEEAIGKASALIEALEYVRSFRGKTVVVKLGGTLMDEGASLRDLLVDVVFMDTVGMRPVLVHGGGKAASAAMKEAGLEAQFVQGHRYTDAQALAIVEHVIVGQLARQIGETISQLGGRPMLLNSLSSCAVTAEKMFLAEGERRIDIGMVGKVVQVNAGLIQAVCQAGYVPVISPIARDRSGGKLNVNADSVAGHVAGALQAEKFVLMSDTHGIRLKPDDPDSLARHVTEPEIERLIEEGVITGGMMPKVEACLTALGAGVRKAHIIDGSIPHALLLEIYTDAGVGTEIVRS